MKCTWTRLGRQDEEDERDDDMDDAMQPLTLDAQFPLWLILRQSSLRSLTKHLCMKRFPNRRLKRFCSHADDTLKDSVPSPSKGIEVDHEDKCVLIDDSPAKGYRFR